MGVAPLLLVVVVVALLLLLLVVVALLLLVVVVREWPRSETVGLGQPPVPTTMMCDLPSSARDGPVLFR